MGKFIDGRWKNNQLRKKNWNYAENAVYFVTICVKSKVECLGTINNNKMIINSYGEIIKKQWLWLQKQYDYILLDEFIIMPDHFHGIIEITPPFDYVKMNNTTNVNCHGIDGINEHYCNVRVGAGRDLHLRNMGINRSTNGEIPQYTKIKPLSEIIGAFKTMSSKQIHLMGFADFYWQRSFYDIIIENSFQLNQIRSYIHNNPIHWRYD